MFAIVENRRTFIGWTSAHTFNDTLHYKGNAENEPYPEEIKETQQVLKGKLFKFLNSAAFLYFQALSENFNMCGRAL